MSRTTSAASVLLLLLGSANACGPGPTNNVGVTPTPSPRPSGYPTPEPTATPVSFCDNFEDDSSWLLKWGATFSTEFDEPTGSRGCGSNDASLKALATSEVGEQGDEVLTAFGMQSALTMPQTSTRRTAGVSFKVPETSSTWHHVAIFPSYTPEDDSRVGVYVDGTQIGIQFTDPSCNEAPENPVNNLEKLITLNKPIEHGKWYRLESDINITAANGTTKARVAISGRLYDETGASVASSSFTTECIPDWLQYGLGNRWLVGFLSVRGEFEPYDEMVFDDFKANAQ